MYAFNCDFIPQQKTYTKRLFLINDKDFYIVAFYIKAFTLVSNSILFNFSKLNIFDILARQMKSFYFS